jgi:transposase, IS5 family
MTERRVGQLSFADGLVADAARGVAKLERIAALIDWREVEELLKGLRGASPTGAPSYPALPLLKAAVLQRWYGLSDPAMEEALADRLSFRRFVGLSLSESVPDHSTLWRFREELGKSGLADKVFAAITRQIEKGGFVLKQGTLIDASLIPSSVNPPPRPTGTPSLDADGRPASKLVRNERDPEAAWAKKGGTYFFGYKAHVAMDEGSRIIRRVLLTPASVNDTVVADQLICGDEQIVYADKAYGTHARSRLLKELGIADGIMRRGTRWHPTSASIAQRNARLRSKRAPIEPLFAQLKHVHAFARARYRGCLRNGVALLLTAIAMNLKRCLALCPMPA